MHWLVLFPKTLTSSVSALRANGTSERKCLLAHFENTQGQNCYIAIVVPGM